jgi:hypothetical protein
MLMHQNQKPTEVIWQFVMFSALITYLSSSTQNCRASFHDPVDRPDFTRTDWAIFQASLEPRLPGHPAANDEGAIDMFVALEAPAPKVLQRADPRPPLSPSIHHELCLKPG